MSYILRIATPTFLYQLWAERFPTMEPPADFIRSWDGNRSMHVISAFKEAECFLRRHPDKNAYDLCKLITSYITRSVRVQEVKQSESEHFKL